MRQGLIVEAHVGVEIGGKGQPEQVGHEAPESHTARPARLDHEDHHRHEQGHDDHHPRPGRTRVEEADAPQEVEHALHAPPPQQSPAALCGGMPRRSEGNAYEHVQRAPCHRKDHARRRERRLGQRRIPLCQSLALEH